MNRETESTDEALAALAAGGDENACSQLLSRHQAGVLTLVRLLAPEQGAYAEDIAQEAFLKAFRGIGSFRGNSSFKTWLYAIAKLTALDWRRGFFRRCLHLVSPLAEHEDSYEALAAPEPHVLDRLAAEESRGLVRRALDSLPHKLKAALLLREWEGLSYEEIAELLDVPEGTVRSRIHNARALLARTLKETLS